MQSSTCASVLRPSTSTSRAPWHSLLRLHRHPPSPRALLHSPSQRTCRWPQACGGIEGSGQARGGLKGSGGGGAVGDARVHAVCEGGVVFAVGGAAGMTTKGGSEGACVCVCVCVCVCLCLCVSVSVCVFHHGLNDMDPFPPPLHIDPHIDMPAFSCICLLLLVFFCVCISLLFCCCSFIWFITS